MNRQGSMPIILHSIPNSSLSSTTGGSQVKEAVASRKGKLGNTHPHIEVNRVVVVERTTQVIGKEKQTIHRG